MNNIDKILKIVNSSKDNFMKIGMLHGLDRSNFTEKDIQILSKELKTLMNDTDAVKKWFYQLNK